MDGKYFIFDDESSIDYGLIIAGIEQNDEVNLGLKRDVLSGTFNRNKQKVFHMGTTWSEPLSFSITLMKNPCNIDYDNEQLEFTENEINSVATWLTSPDYPTLFHMFDYYFQASPDDSVIAVNFGPGQQHTYLFEADGYQTVKYTVTRDGDQWSTLSSTDALTPPQLSVALAPDYVSFSTQDEDYVRAITMICIDGDPGNARHQVDKFYSYDFDPPYYTVLNHTYDYYGVFDNIEAQTINGKIVSLVATFVTNSPFAWTPLMTIDAQNNELLLRIRSADKYREIYPLIAFTPAVDDGSSDLYSYVTFRNTRDDLGIQLKLYQGVTTYVDCEKCIIYYDNQSENIYTNIDDILEQEINTITENGEIDNLHIYWPKLYYGENKIEITGDCQVSISYREPRKVGEY